MAQRKCVPAAEPKQEEASRSSVTPHVTVENCGKSGRSDQNQTDDHRLGGNSYLLCVFSYVAGIQRVWNQQPKLATYQSNQVFTPPLPPHWDQNACVIVNWYQFPTVQAASRSHVAITFHSYPHSLMAFGPDAKMLQAHKGFWDYVSMKGCPLQIKSTKR